MARWQSGLSHFSHKEGGFGSSLVRNQPSLHRERTASSLDFIISFKLIFICGALSDERLFHSLRLIYVKLDAKNAIFFIGIFGKSAKFIYLCTVIQKRHPSDGFKKTESCVRTHVIDLGQNR